MNNSLKSRKTNLVDETKELEDDGKGKEEICNRCNYKMGMRRKQKDLPIAPVMLADVFNVKQSGRRKTRLPVMH